MEKVENDIILGRSENQAIELLKVSLSDSTADKITEIVATDKFAEFYNRIVRKMYALNVELAKEAISNLNKNQQPLIKDDTKWLKCPKCSGWIKQEWKEHKKCGWKP